MPGYSRDDVILVKYPFSDASSVKVRPAVIVSAPHPSKDLFIVPLTSRTESLLAGEFLLSDWADAGLNVPSAVKRGIYTIHQDLIMRRVGRFTQRDADKLKNTLSVWLDLGD